MMANRKSLPMAIPVAGSYMEPAQPALKKESGWSNSGWRAGEVPAGMHFKTSGPEKRMPYGESCGIQLPAKRGRGMRKSMGE